VAGLGIDIIFVDVLYGNRGGGLCR